MESLSTFSRRFRGASRLKQGDDNGSSEARSSPFTIRKEGEGDSQLPVVNRGGGGAPPPITLISLKCPR